MYNFTNINAHTVTRNEIADKHARLLLPVQEKREKHGYVCAKMISVCNLYAKTENSQSSYNILTLVQQYT